MSDAVIVAIITASITLLGTILTYLTSTKQIQNKQSELQTAQLNALKAELNNKLDSHNKEYIDGIEHVKESLNNINNDFMDMKATYQETVAVIELKIDTLEKKQDKHNNVIERTFQLEKDVAVLQAKAEANEKAN